MARLRTRNGGVRQVKRGGWHPPAATRIHPLPWVIDPDREWTVQEWRPGTPIPPHVYRGSDENRIATPFDSSEMARGIRFHELAHVKWTPPAPSTEGLDPMTVNAVEDCRIHKRLKEQGFDRPAVCEPRMFAGWKRGLEDGSLTPLQAARLLAACINTGDEKPFRNMLDEVPGAEWIAPIVDGLYDVHIRPRRPAWKRTIAMGRDLEAAFMPPPDPDPDTVLPGGFLPGADLDEWEKNIREDYRSDMSKPARWGAMSITRPPLRLKLPRAMRVRTNRAHRSGSVPRYWHRLATDGAVFARKVKLPGGGAVLIDQSGSMNLSPAQVVSIMEAMPGCVIAAYAGDATTGELRVLAENGKRVTDKDAHLEMGGNTVDGPALEWLATQPGPRYWVSDGCVVGSDGSLHPALLNECRGTCARASIARVGTADALIGRLRDSGATPEGWTA